MITFKTENAHIAFHSMAEGMMENALDDSDGTRALALETLIGATAWRDGGSYPMSFPLSVEATDTARIVIENIDDNERLDNEDYDPHAIVLTDDNRPMFSERGQFGAAEALEEAIEIVRQRCAETDTASPEGYRARCTLQTLSDILDQRGCEQFDPAVTDGKLTTLIDVIVFG